MQHSNSFFSQLLKTIRSLRGKNGCPWDQGQTTQSLTKYLKEESQELLLAIKRENNQEICEELGDLLFVLLLMAQINEEQGSFTLNDVLQTVNAKQIRRHPHVFAGLPVGDEESLNKQWQKIKAEEKAKKTV